MLQSYPQNIYQWQKREKTQTFVHLGLSMLDPSKTVIYESWYDYIKPKYGEKAKQCYKDTDTSLFT